MNNKQKLNRLIGNCDCIEHINDYYDLMKELDDLDKYRYFHKLEKYRTEEEYKEEIFDKLNDDERFEWLYNASLSACRFSEENKKLEDIDEENKKLKDKLDKAYELLSMYTDNTIEYWKELLEKEDH